MDAQSDAKRDPARQGSSVQGDPVGDGGAGGGAADGVAGGTAGSTAGSTAGTGDAEGGGKPLRPLGSRAPRYVQARRPLHLSWQVGVFLVGLVIVVTGVILLPLPGPGWLIIFGGMAVWATEFVWAQLVMRWTKRKLAEGTAYLKRRRAERAARKRS